MYFGGQVSEMPITEGQMVNEGDMLASYKMDRPSMMEIHQILYAEGVLGLKRALFDQEIALDKLTNISLPLKKSRLERLEKEVADLKQLQARNMAPEAAVDLKEREVDAAKKEIVEVKESIKQAEDSIKKTKKDLQFGEDRRKRALDLLEWQTNRSYTDPDSKVPLDVAFLKAPITGQVVWIAPMARVGAELPKGFHAMTLHPKDGIVVRCKVHELDLVKLKTGDRGTVSFDAFPEKEYACKVSRIPWVSRNPILEMPADYEIECSLEKTEATFQEGLTCNVKVRITQ
jgi:multidrug resistance efflux pump